MNKDYFISQPVYGDVDRDYVAARVCVSYDPVPGQVGAHSFRNIIFREIKYVTPSGAYYCPGFDLEISPAKMVMNTKDQFGSIEVYKARIVINVLLECEHVPSELKSKYKTEVNQ